LSKNETRDPVGLTKCSEVNAYKTLTVAILCFPHA
jgi:hypothetical protein